uniref:Uncharacterized protein n=1 Tax=viral metagenome TaxID=1070528 RepID=A0A6C0E722_9ZZZZ
MADEDMGRLGRGQRLRYLTPKQLQHAQELEEARAAKAKRKSVRASRAAEAEQHRLARPYVRIRSSRRQRHSPVNSARLTRGRMYNLRGPFRYETSRSRNLRSRLSPALVREQRLAERRRQLAPLSVIVEEEEDLGLNMGGLSLGKGGGYTVKNRRRR